VRSEWFETLSMAIIALNSIWLFIDTDYNDAPVLVEAAWYFQVMENLFCLCFSMELILIFTATKKKIVKFLEPWFLFDFVIVASMVAETWIVTIVYAVAGRGIGPLGNVPSSLLRVLRLLRVTRISRMMHRVPELSYILKGIFEGFRSVTCTLFLLFVLVYTFGIMLVLLSKGNAPLQSYFSDVPTAVYRLFVHIILLDGIAEVLDNVRAESKSCFLLLTLVLVLGSMMLMNMLIGVLCEIVGHVASREKEGRDIEKIKQFLLESLWQLDAGHDGFITSSNFAAIIENDTAIDALAQVGVEANELAEFARPFFQSNCLEGECLRVDDFMDIVMKLRGQTHATTTDLVKLLKLQDKEQARRELVLTGLLENMDKLATLVAARSGPCLRDAGGAIPESASQISKLNLSPILDPVCRQVPKFDFCRLNLHGDDDERPCRKDTFGQSEYQNPFEECM